MMLVSGWRLALRLAWREAWRAKGRSLLVLVMVTFPVVAVVAADVVQATSSVSSVEGLDRRLGTAQARIQMPPGAGHVFQPADPDSGYGSSGTPRGSHHAVASLADVEHALGGARRPAIELRTGVASIHSRLGLLAVDATAVDLHSPLARGLFRLTSGRLPTGDGEVAINAALAAQGYAVGDRVTEADGTTVTIVGTVESTSQRNAQIMVGGPGWLPADVHGSPPLWLLGGAPVTWSQVLAANAVGAVVLSREVIEHPPSSDQLPAQVRQIASDNRTSLYTVLILIGVMALIEVVLLAGPAFAVGARRQSRSLALIAANGGTPAQSRRVVLASAMVIGALAAVVGGALGTALARLLLPVLQPMSETWFGPFQVRWTHVLGIAAFGLVSAVLAAVVPAWIASRQDVVAVLAGRRGDRAASRRSPYVGLALVGLGIVVAFVGSRQGSGETLIAGSAILTILGMIFLVPVVVLGVARLGRRLPLPLRYAVRDAARHRTRTVPAVAAVAATVAGVVALSIGNTSDQAQARASYTPQLAPGLSSIAMNGGHTDWSSVTAAVARVAPAATATRVSGVRGSRALEISMSGAVSQDAFASSLPTQALVSDGSTLPVLLRTQVSASAWARASAVLRQGGVVSFGPSDGQDARTRVRLSGGPSVRVPSVTVGIGDATPLVEGVVSPQVASALHLHVLTVGMLLTGPTLTQHQEDDLRQVLSGMDRDAYLYTERGYQESGSEKVVLWILFGLAAVLMLGGTLTSTFLALSDARPDLATLSAVGASPVTRRAVAAAYAVSVGLVGAVLGAAVGFVPGIAVSYPLTRQFQPMPGVAHASHTLAIPWLEIVGLVVALPLVTALLVGLVARSRLPLVARLD